MKDMLSIGLYCTSMACGVIPSLRIIWWCYPTSRVFSIFLCLYSCGWIWLFYCQGFISYVGLQHLVSELFFGPKEENFFRVFGGRNEDEFFQFNFWENFYIISSIQPHIWIPLSKTPDFKKKISSNGVREVKILLI